MQLGRREQKATEESKQTQSSAPKGNKWLLKATGQFLLVTVCLSLAYIRFILIDALVQSIIVLTLGDIITKYDFLRNWVDGFKILSAAIIGLVYLFHLLYAVFDQVRFVLRVFQEMQEEEREA